MAGKNIKIQVGLDFTANNLTIEKIKDQMDTAFKAMKINLDPAEYKKVEAQLKKLGELAEANLNKSTGKMNFKGLDNAISNNHDVISSFDRLTTTMTKGGVVGDATFKKISTANEHFKKGLVESNGLLTKMGTTLMNTIRWNISASAINTVTGELQRAYGFAKDLDRSLTNIRIVSGESAANMTRFSKEANRASQELKVSTIDYADAALLFYQQGLKAIEVQNMTRAAIIGGNITGESTAEMSNLLTAVLNGYKIATEDVITVTDKLAAVGAETAADFHELATAMSKVASMAHAAGVPLDSLNAQIATIVSVTRESPESIGTSLKTIYGRMLMFKTDTEALMKDDDGEVFGAPKVEEALQAYNRAAGAQISLFKTTKDGKRELRDLGEVIEEVGNSWDTVTDKTAKFGLATALAGSRQQNRLVALFESWDMYKEAVTTSLEAEGTSLLQNAVYMDSYDAKLKGLKATKEELYMSLTNTDGLKTLVDALTSIIKVVTKISDLTGGLSMAFGLAGAALVKSGIDKIVSGTLPSLSLGAGEKESASELKMRQQLLTIERAYGKERAESHRVSIKAAVEDKALALERRDILLAEGTLLEDIEEIQTSSRSQAAKDLAIATLIEENQHLSITPQMILEIQNAYSALETERANLKVLMEEAGGEAASETLQKKIDASRKAIDDMEHAIARIHNTNVSQTKTANQAVGLTTKIEAGEIKKINQLEVAARKTATATAALQTGFMMLPSVIGAVGDSSKSAGDVLKTVGTTAIPALTSGLMKAVPAMVAAKEAGTSMLAAMAPAVVPVLAVAAAIGVLAFAAKKFAEQHISFKDAFGNLEGASNELEEVKAGYDTLSQKLVDIATRLREINTIQREGGLTAVDSEALDKEAIALERKRAELEQQLTIENLLISAAEKKLELAAREAAEATMKSDYSKGIIGDKVTVDEELERSIEAYKVAGLMVKSYQRDIAALDTESKTYEKDLAKLTASMEKQEGIRNTAKQNIALHSAAIKKIIADLDTEDGANKDLIESLEGVLEAGLAVAEADLAASGIVRQSTDDIIENTEAVDANRIAQEEKDEAMQKLIDAYDEVTNKIKTYNDFLYELNTSEELSAKTKQEIILKHAELAPYIENEQELRKQLIKLIEAEEQAQIDAYVLMMASSEEFFNGKLKGNKDLAGELRKAYNIELDDFKSLAEAKAKVEENLISGLSTHWAKYYDTQSKSLVFTEDQWNNMTHGQQQEYGAYRGQLKEVANRFKGITLDLAPIDFKKINVGLSGAGSRSKDSSSTKEQYSAEANAYQKINLELEKNNNLLAQNKLQQDQAGDDIAKKIKLMEEEIELNKERQSLLNQYNTQLREEAKSLQEDLSSIFNFEGSWDDNSMIITNLDEIAGKSEEVDKKFKRIIAIMGELPKGSQEWWKLKNAIDKINLDKLIAGFELADQKLNKLQKSLSTLEYEFKLLGGSDIDRKVENIVKQIENLEQQLIDAQSELKSLGEVGEQSPKAIKDRFEELTKRIQDSTLAVKAHEKSLIDMREALRVEYVKKLNDAYSEQQDRLSKLASIQEVIVQIIRKRGEEERKQLDDNHKAEMDSLEERHNKRIQMYKDDLDAFREMVQGKITELDEQYEEEDYLEALNKEREVANDIQRQIDVLSLDDSLTAKNQVIQLNKDLAKQNDKIATMQRDRERKLNKKSLNDQVTDKEKATDKMIDIENESYEEQKKFYEEDYNNHKKYLEWKYSDEQVYAEAKESIMRGTVEVAEGMFVDIYEAYQDFEDKFGKGMGILGDIIKKDFLDQLEKAQQAIRELDYLSSNRKPQYDSGYDPGDDALGWKDPPRDKPNPSDSGSSGGIYMSREDFSQYRVYKMLYEAAQESNDRATMDETYRLAHAIRKKYGIVGDKYSFSDLQGKSYNDVRFKRGGETEKTGLHILDGKLGEPERVLSSEQTKGFNKLIFEDMPKLQSMLKTFDLSNFQKLPKSAVLSTVSVPKLPSAAGKQGVVLQIENFIKADNITKDSIPELKKVQVNAMEDLKNLLIKNGVRPSLI